MPQALFICLSLLFILCAQNSENKYVKTLREYFHRNMVWNSVLCFFNETFLLTSVSCMSNFIDLKWGHFGERFNSLISIFAAFFALFLYPLLYLRFMRKNKDNFDEKLLKDKYGILYENLKYKKGGPTILEPFFNQMRILILVGSLIYLQKFRYF